MSTRLLSGAAGLPRAEPESRDELRGHARGLRDHLSALAAHKHAMPVEAQRALQALESELEALEKKLRVRPVSIPPPVRGADKAPEAARPRILVAEDGDDMRMLLEMLFSDLYAVTLVDNGEAALKLLLAQRFDLALIDVKLPRLSGFEIAERLRERPGAVPQPIMYLSGESSPAFKIRGLELGASDYVTKPFDAEELLARVARIVAAGQREESLRLEAMTDLLTGLANYRAFAESLEREFARSRRYDQPLCVLTVDLDHLKAINDSGGHEAGNGAICLVASVLKDGVRKFELVARQGGDEFSVLLPNTSEAEALQIAERLRVRVAEHEILGKPLSVSIGLGARPKASEMTLRELVQKSDEALYLAKRMGRNRVASSTRGALNS